MTAWVAARGYNDPFAIAGLITAAFVAKDVDPTGWPA